MACCEDLETDNIYSVLQGEEAEGSAEVGGGGGVESGVDREDIGGGYSQAESGAVIESYVLRNSATVSMDYLVT